MCMDTGTPSQTLQVLVDSDATVADGARCEILLGGVTALRGWLDSYEAGVTTRLAALHDEDDGTPAADVHTDIAGVSAGEARRRERRAAVIDRVPVFGEALAAGRIGAEHVDALANAVVKLDSDVRDRLFAVADQLLVQAEAMSPDRFARRVRERARRLERDGGVGRNEQQRRETCLSRKLNARTGMIEGRFALHPELASQIFGAIDREMAALIAEGEQAGDRDIIDRSVDRNRLAAQAWGRLIAGGHQQRRPLEADITLLVDHHTAVTGEIHDHTICETSDGATLPPTSVQRLLCTGRITPIIIDQHGNTLDAGRTIRNANCTERRALRAMYQCCAFGDCDIAFDRCDIHHILPWELGGPTDLHNLIPLCSRHHHVIHDHGWVLDLSPDRTLTITKPDGQPFALTEPDVPPQRQPHRHPKRSRQPAA